MEISFHWLDSCSKFFTNSMLGRFPFNLELYNFQNGDKWFGNFIGDDKILGCVAGGISSHFVLAAKP